MLYIEERQAGENGRDYALRMITENIIDLNLKPGSMVSEKDLASELGLSRTPVREALMDLAKVGMVEVYPQRGSRISLIDYELVEDTQFTRNILEGAVVQLACERAAEADLKALKENVMLQEFYINNSQKLMELDNAFHRELFRIGGRMHTYNMLSSFSIHFDRVRQMALRTSKELKIVEDHKKIYEAIARKDAKTAQNCMEEHLARYKVDEVAIRENYPSEYFA